MVVVGGGRGGGGRGQVQWLKGVWSLGALEGWKFEGLRGWSPGGSKGWRFWRSNNVLRLRLLRFSVF